ncbi:uncharacterized protein PFL1_01073 [Pseudozyma flocculosa PF-1]|uniref:Related to CAP59 (Required for capsule formation) n=1 Tax=Pseudozyma flocculosa TaxID=84751 RepID=A0A5C3FER8_9BASI|nr:uncharacterized protein PFL1_01073 [Pseudozyma flocculosa PF-1]EPQ31741.1 hypothetical protein PFL1_01073 [Pseudozyma flocculosa PF-1]SPO41869.1 related to CAP59 (required for capsule formation) [Pseudozyma flocculosa]
MSTRSSSSEDRLLPSDSSVDGSPVSTPYDDGSDDYFEEGYSLKPQKRPSTLHQRLVDARERLPLGLASGLAILAVSTALHVFFGMFSTVHLFLAGCMVLVVNLFTSIGSSASRCRSEGAKPLLRAVSSCLLLAVIFLACTHHSPSRQARLTLPPVQSNGSYFIAANLYNSESLFPAFSDSLLRLSDMLGHSNVYVSIYESNSKDSTKDKLAELAGLLERQAIPHTIRSDNDGIKVAKNNQIGATQAHIQYLADVRNIALAPLDKGLRSVGGRPFSHVVWLNDVFWRPESVLELLATNGGEFDQACGLDFIPLGFYDTWVTRDAEGTRLKPLWPYFERPADIDSLRAGQPIPVRSCWNGMTAFRADLFVPQSNATQAGTAAVAAKATPEQQPNTTTSPTSPLRFHTFPKCVVSECLLASYDIHLRTAPTPARIFVNPRAIATYDWPSSLLYDSILRTRLLDPWVVLWQDFVSHRLFGWMSEVGRKTDKCSVYLEAGWTSSDQSSR